MYKALKTFTGLEKMKKGQVKDLKDENIINDLLNAGYIEKIKEEETKAVNETEKIETEIKKDVEKIKAKKSKK